ncbi:MAG: hypothetical protein ABIR91_01070 [Candidatus Saccharimonadales bacterium]
MSAVQHLALRAITTAGVELDKEGQVPTWLMKIIQHSLFQRMIATHVKLTVLQPPRRLQEGTPDQVYLQASFTMLPRVRSDTATALAHIEATVFTYSTLDPQSTRSAFWDRMPEALYDVEESMFRPNAELVWPHKFNLLHTSSRQSTPAWQPDSM